MTRSPIVDHDATEPAACTAGNLLEGARRQKGLPEGRVPASCLLDMDGERGAQSVFIRFLAGIASRFDLGAANGGWS